MRPEMRKFAVEWAVASALAAGSATLAGASVNVTTQHNDNGRSGYNAGETLLNTTNVNANAFGKLYSVPMDGFIYAQPLYLSGVIVNGATHNVVYVATAHNSVYALDADTGVQLWFRHLGTPVPSDVIGTPNIRVEVGIISTPVIDTASHTIYVVTKNYENGTQLFRLHALDTATGLDHANSPTLITASVNGNGDGNDGNGHVPFLPEKENQRVALTLAGDAVYLAFASHEDFDPYHGWVLRYNKTSLAQTAVFNASPNGGRDGIWQGGQGAVVDGNGNLYYMTGNGTSDAQVGGLSYGECFIKLSAGLTLTDWFMPNNFDLLNQWDADLGSGGPVAIPGTSMIVGCGKQGLLYLVNTTNLGKYNAGSDAILQEFQAANALWGAPVFANNTLYIWGVGDYLKAYPFANNRFQTSPSSTSTVAAPWGGDPCGAITVSSNGNMAGSAIVWGTIPLGDPDHDTVPGALYAFDANNLQKELWDSRQNAKRDDYGNFAKFCSPTVANGKVFVATDSGQLAVYGLLISPPGATGALTATPASGKVQLKWSAASGATLYMVKRATAAAGPFSIVTRVNSLQYSDGNVMNGRTYFYEVSGINSAGQGPDTTPVPAIPQAWYAAPVAPAGLNFATVAGQITLNWNASGYATGYRVKRATANAGPYVTVGTAASGPFADKAVTAGKTYYYQVTAYNAYGESPASSTVIVVAR